MNLIDHESVLLHQFNVYHCRYEIMLSCWRENPKERPKFSEVTQRLEELLNMTKSDNGAAANGEADGYLSPTGNPSPKEPNSYANPDYIILLNTHAPAPYGADEGYLPMDGASL